MGFKPLYFATQVLRMMMEHAESIRKVTCSARDRHALGLKAGTRAIS